MLVRSCDSCDRREPDVRVYAVTVTVEGAGGVQMDLCQDHLPPMLKALQLKSDQSTAVQGVLGVVGGKPAG